MFQVHKKYQQILTFENFKITNTFDVLTHLTFFDSYDQELIDIEYLKKICLHYKL